MTTPESPANPPQYPPPATTTPPPPSAPPSGTDPNSYQNVSQNTSGQEKGAAGDPLGIWQNFLSMGGTEASKQQVEMFLNSLVKFMASAVINEANKAAKQEYLRTKAVIEGRDPNDIN